VAGGAANFNTLLNMAPARYPEELAKFRQWVRQAEAKQSGALLRGGVAESFAL
jgi:hypothetical protein